MWHVEEERVASLVLVCDLKTTNMSGILTMKHDFQDLTINKYVKYSALSLNKNNLSVI
jgi:hypothetical protein